MNEKQISIPDDFLEKVAKVYGQNHGIIAAYRSGHARPAIVFYERACEPISALQVAQAY